MDINIRYLAMLALLMLLNMNIVLAHGEDDGFDTNLPLLNMEQHLFWPL